MSTDIVRFHKTDTGQSEKTFHPEALYLFLEISLPLIIVTVSSWYGFYRWVTWKEKRKLESISIMDKAEPQRSKGSW